MKKIVFLLVATMLAAPVMAAVPTVPSQTMSKHIVHVAAKKKHVKKHAKKHKKSTKKTAAAPATPVSTDTSAGPQ